MNVHDDISFLEDEEAYTNLEYQTPMQYSGNFIEAMKKMDEITAKERDKYVEHFSKYPGFIHMNPNIFAAALTYKKVDNPGVNVEDVKLDYYSRKAMPADIDYDSLSPYKKASIWASIFRYLDWIYSVEAE